MLTWVDIIWFLRVLGWLRYGCLCLGVCGLFGVRCCWFDCGWVVCGFDCLTGWAGCMVFLCGFRRVLDVGVVMGFGWLRVDHVVWFVVVCFVVVCILWILVFRFLGFVFACVV